MKTVAVISQKGGPGKTTITVNLAVASQIAGDDTAIIDLDPQASSANWSDRRQALSELPVVISAHASRLRNEIAHVKASGGQMLYIDTAPKSDSASLEAAKHADLILIPCKPAIFDLDAIESTVDLIKTTGKPIYVVFNAVKARDNDWQDAAAALKDLQVDVCPVLVGDRVAFSRSPINGHGALEYRPRDPKACDEIERLHTFVCEHIPTLETA